MTSFRSWIAFASEHSSHWLGSIARDIQATGWIGTTPEQLRAFLKENSFPDELLSEVDQLARFFALYKQREEHVHGR
jgi:hypothetical protein